MDISARTDYAIRAMLMLAQETQSAGVPVSVDTLAHRQTLPRKFLETILGDLRRAGIVVSQRGSSGGYTLSRPAAQISLGDIFRVVDGPLAEVRGLTHPRRRITGWPSTCRSCGLPCAQA